MYNQELLKKSPYREKKTILVTLSLIWGKDKWIYQENERIREDDLL